MASGIMMNLQEEVTCPICLELLTEPLSLDCGHSFCQACITANNMASMSGQNEERRCPVCRISYEPGNLRPNRHVANIVQRLREVKLSPEVEQEKNLCLRHGEKLMLFCEEDREVICWLCERSQEHHGHHTFLMEEIAQDYQTKLREALEKLKEKQLEAEELEVKVRAQIAAWKDQIQHERQNVKAVFQKLRKNLKYEEVKEMQKLKSKEEVGLRNLADSERMLIQQSQLVRNLISDVDRRLKGSTTEMLQDLNKIDSAQTKVQINALVFGHGRTYYFLTHKKWYIDLLSISVHKSSETLTLKKLRTLPKGQRRMCSALDLTDIQRVYNGEGCYLSGCLWNSCDGGKMGRRLQFLDMDRDSKAQILCADDYVYWRYQPKYSYWIIGLKIMFRKKKILFPPIVLGVFLTCNTDVLFVNVTDQGILIYKLSSCSFTQRMFPYFSPGKRNAPITL
ncbi:hypothetical protein FD754_012349 [Muntiacus muntjak]|uniref:Tripartite motif-containing protein 5 n=1 Tax=Muntiacus muntjak TaxID=9888 RepID=A0A5N3VEE0_MUNMU|nr:hypothetical protein FD754_012349 [Muntiacus muntjak]